VDSVTTDPDGTRVVGAMWERTFNGVGVGVNSKGQVGPSYRFSLEAVKTHLSIRPPGEFPRMTDAMHDYKLGDFWACMVRALDAPAPAPMASEEAGTSTPTSAR